MAEKQLNTRIQLKYDSYTNWTTKNPVLKAGELAIATIETNADGVKNAPSVVVKVGDGTTAYNELKFISAMAADVSPWAKAETKPTYQASEIEGLDSFIAGEIQDTNTEYVITKVDDYTYKLQYYTEDGTLADVADCDTIVIPKYDDSAIKADIAEIEGKVTTLVGEDTDKTVRSIAVEEVTKIVAGASEDFDTLKEMETWLTEHESSATEMNTAIQKNKTDISTINVELDDIDSKLTENDTAHTEINGRIDTVVGSVTTLDNSLATIAKTGNVNDLIQTEGDVLVFNCGYATL